MKKLLAIDSSVRSPLWRALQRARATRESRPQRHAFNHQFTARQLQFLADDGKSEKLVARCTPIAHQILSVAKPTLDALLHRYKRAPGCLLVGDIGPFTETFESGETRSYPGIFVGLSGLSDGFAAGLRGVVREFCKSKGYYFITSATQSGTAEIFEHYPYSQEAGPFMDRHLQELLTEEFTRFIRDRKLPFQLSPARLKALATVLALGNKNPLSPPPNFVLNNKDILSSSSRELKAIQKQLKKANSQAKLRLLSRQTERRLERSEGLGSLKSLKLYRELHRGVDLSGNELFSTKLESALRAANDSLRAIWPLALSPAADRHFFNMELNIIWPFLISNPARPFTLSPDQKVLAARAIKAPCVEKHALHFARKLGVLLKLTKLGMGGDFHKLLTTFYTTGAKKGELMPPCHSCQKGLGMPNQYTPRLLHVAGGSDLTGELLAGFTLEDADGAAEKPVKREEPVMQFPSMEALDSFMQLLGRDLAEAEEEVPAPAPAANVREVEDRRARLLRTPTRQVRHGRDRPVPRFSPGMTPSPLKKPRMKRK